MKRASGILMHITTLWGEYSIGGFGESAKQFIDFLVDCGFTYWQVLPFGVPDEYNSPYKSYSAFAGNPYFIDIYKLYQDGLITDSELESQKRNSPFLCEYDRLRSTRFDVLKNASLRVDRTLREKIEIFAESNKHILQFCIFMALKEANEGREWLDFFTDVYDEDTLFAWKFIQYEFFYQWKEIKAYANQRGIYIIGDMPIYVSHDSADLFFNKDIFDVDKDGKMKNVAGVPPDYFSECGQLWGNPLYNWENMQRNDFLWWRERMIYNLNMFDGVRIDHFRGLESFWSIPAGAHDAKVGKWVNGGGKAFIDEICRVIGDDAIIIAEDLGEITPEVSELVRYSGFSGMRVFQFAFLGDPNSTHLPHNYTHNCVAYTGTHDNSTLLGYIMELDDMARKQVFEYCGYKGESFDEGCKCIVRTILASHADIVIFPIQDILGYGNDTRMNTPGSSIGNWQIRFLKEQIDSINRNEIYRLNKLYGRV